MFSRRPSRGRCDESPFRKVCPLAFICLLLLAAVPQAHAATAVTFYMGSTSTGSCSGGCWNLPASTGTAITTTKQTIATSGTVPRSIIVRSAATSTTTCTPSEGTPCTYAWETANTLAGATIGSGTWAFAITLASSKTSSGGTAYMWMMAWSCTTISLGTCTYLTKYYDNTTNVATVGTTAVKETYTTGTVGPFSSVAFLVVEYWLYITANAASSSNTMTDTTVSSASSVTLNGGLTLPESYNAGSMAPTTSYAQTATVTETYGVTASPTATYGNTVTASESYTATASVSGSYGNAVTASESYTATASVAATYSQTATVTETYSADSIPVAGSYSPSTTANEGYGVSGAISTGYSRHSSPPSSRTARRSPPPPRIPPTSWPPRHTPRASRWLPPGRPT